MVFNKQGKHRIKTKVKDVKEGHSEAGKVTESIEEVKASSFFFIFFYFICHIPVLIHNLSICKGQEIRNKTTKE